MRRVITISGQSLIALDAKTGMPAAGFGTGGAVDLSKGYRRPAASMRWTSVPLIVRDVIVVGGLPTAPDGNFMPGDIRGYDVRTGKQVWTFNVIPEFGDVRKRHLAEGFLRLFRRGGCVGSDERGRRARVRVRGH